MSAATPRDELRPAAGPADPQAEAAAPPLTAEATPDRAATGWLAAAGTWVALAVLVGGVVLAFTVGRYPVSLAQVGQVIAAQVTGTDAAVAPAVETVVLRVRGPRVLAALLVGAALSVAGAAFQGLFRNPLVSPDILGASAGAALGAVLGIYFSIGLMGIQLAAFIGGLLAVGLVLALARTLRSPDPVLGLLMIGIVVGSLLGAGLGLMKVLADPYDQLPAMTFWLLGSLASTGRDDLPALAGPVALGTAALLALRWRLNVMTLPDDEARALGASTARLRLALIVAATLVTSASVAAAGIVGWVGLVVPHLARLLVGPSFPRLLPTAALLGGGFLLLIDTLARTMATVEVPLGVLTAVVGTPFFLWLLRRAQPGRS